MALRIQWQSHRTDTSTCETFSLAHTLRHKVNVRVQNLATFNPSLHCSGCFCNNNNFYNQTQSLLIPAHSFARPNTNNKLRKRKTTTNKTTQMFPINNSNSNSHTHIKLVNELCVVLSYVHLLLQNLILLTALLVCCCCSCVRPFVC